MARGSTLDDRPEGQPALGVGVTIDAVAHPVQVQDVRMAAMVCPAAAIELAE